MYKYNSLGLQTYIYLSQATMSSMKNTYQLQNQVMLGTWPLAVPEQITLLILAPVGGGGVALSVLFTLLPSWYTYFQIVHNNSQWNIHTQM